MAGSGNIRIEDNLIYENDNDPQNQQQIDPKSRPKNGVIYPKEEDIAINSLIRPPVSDTATCWCTISYFELDERVGDIYKSTSRHVTVDGHCTTSDNNRLCLGMMINPNQNPVAAKIRPMIGKGCSIYHLVEDDVDCINVECCSESPIFVQSPLHAVLVNDDLSTVYRLPSKSKIKVYDRKFFDEMLNKAKKDGYHALYDLHTMCTVRISFVKGYGAHYNRPTITTTPCWIEVKLMDPMQALACALDAVEVPKIEIPID